MRVHKGSGCSWRRVIRMTTGLPRERREKTILGSGNSMGEALGVRSVGLDRGSTGSSWGSPQVPVGDGNRCDWASALPPPPTLPSRFSIPASVLSHKARVGLSQVLWVGIWVLSTERGKQVSVGPSLRPALSRKCQTSIKIIKGDEQPLNSFKSRTGRVQGAGEY